MKIRRSRITVKYKDPRRSFKEEHVVDVAPGTSDAELRVALGKIADGAKTYLAVLARDPSTR